MDYMLLRSGDVMVIDDEPKVPEMHELMEKHDGAAYYWYVDQRGWYYVDRDEVSKRSQRIKDVPDIIKLAAMLQ